MKITKLLNNNVIIAKDIRKGEVVIMGTGIGYQAKIGDHVQTQKIQKVFVLNDHSKLAELISQIPASYLELVEKIVEYTNDVYQIKLNENIYLTLSDHIYFANKRIKEKMDIDNPFLIDVKLFYKDEFEIAKYAKGLIKGMYGIEIPEEEVGYIALHIIENAYNQEKRSVGKSFDVMNETIAFVKTSYLKNIDENSLSYTRLINHVKHFAKRFVDEKENEVDNTLLLQTLGDVFLDECACVNQLSKHLFQKFGREIKDSEKNYLILHLRNCKELN